MINVQTSTIYPCVAEFKNSLIKQLNEPFKPDKPLGVYRTDKYLVIKCKYKGCVFALWYNENKNKGKLG